MADERSNTGVPAFDRERVTVETHRCLSLAGAHFDQAFASIPVRFDLRGRAAGMYCREGERRWFRYNPWIFARHPDSIRDTVAHEVAHYVADLVWPPRPGRRRIRPHGREWRSVMALFGADPSATHDLALDEVPVRRQRRFAYLCACREHQLTATTHNRIQHRRWRYTCTHCGELLRRKRESSPGAPGEAPGQLLLPWGD